MSSKNTIKNRRKSGLAITALMAFIAIFIILPIAFFVYEMTQYNLCQQQLKACVDSAALTAACSTTASNSNNPATTQTNAMNQAAYMFAANSILVFPLTTTPAYSYGTANPVWTPVANQAQLYFEFLDPVTMLPVPYGSPNGKIMRVFGSFGFVPVFSNFGFANLGVGPYVVAETSDGGLPMLDVVLCFDISSSMDDFTNTTLVKRYDNGGVNKYALPPSINVAGNNTVPGPLYYAIGGTNTLGLSANATYPLDLPTVLTPGQGVLQFDTAGHGTHHGAPAPLPLGGLILNGFTDCVVNLDGTATESTGITVNGCFFPPDDLATHKGIGTLVEAARGNLESTAIATAAHVPYAAWGVTPTPGYFNAYYQASMSANQGFPDPSVTVPLRHPIGDAIVAAKSFFGILVNDADVHFGLVTFSDPAGTKDSPGDPVHPGSYYVGSYAADSPIVSTPYPTDPIQPPRPAIYLNPTLGPAFSNYDGSGSPAITSVNGALWTNTAGTFSSVMAEGGTNINDALDLALAMQLGSKASDPSSTPNGRAAMTLGRPGATRAIVLFTDGLPNSAGDIGVGDPKSQAEATFAKAAGIPIYTIGLCLTPTLQPLQTTVLTDSGGTGIAFLSGNGATFTQTTNPAQLNAVFQNVARQLVQLVR